MKWALIIMTTFIILGTGYLFYLAELDGVINPVLTLKTKEALVVGEKEVKAGSVIKIHLDYCKHRDIPAVVSTKFIDTIQYSVQDYISQRPVGCNKPTATTGVLVPAQLPSGTYFLEQIFTYKINPLKTVTYKLTSDEFLIINEK